jgi:SAM-dependent methyltransferase
MQRIRTENVNTAETFNGVFEDNLDLFDSYKNIAFYDKSLELGLFEDASYLDYGCGGGRSLDAARAGHPGLKVYGVDISDVVIKKNQELYPACGFLEVDAFWSGDLKADHILSSHTFEHLEDPLAMMKKLWERANKSLTVIVPNEDSWNNCEQHLWRFDKSSFAETKPSLVLAGIINRAANRELIFHWRKDEDIRRSKCRFALKILRKHSLIGLIKIFLRILGIYK